MIFPTHCRFVGVINKYERKDYRPDDILYFSSRYVIVFDKRDKCEIYEVTSEGEGVFLKKKTGAKKIAGTDETLVYDRQVDITNRADLLKRAKEVCRDGITTAVFKGIDQHLTFVKDPAENKLSLVDVFDISPPSPSWLEYNLKRLEEAGMFGELMLTFNYDILDLKKFEDKNRTTIFPCYASGLDGLFLDSLDIEPTGDIKLVGCNTSKLVFESRWPGKPYEHVNICPLSTRKPVRPFILRCCQSDKLGLKDINGIPGVVVHWGANPREIYEAVKLLAEKVNGMNTK